MDWPKYVTKTFWRYVNSNANKSLAASLKNSPRTKTFLDNLSSEISKAERLVHKRRGRPLKIETIRMTVIDMTKLLLRGIEKEANSRVESIAEASRKKAEADYLKDLEETSEGRPTGVFEGLDIEQSETEVKETSRSSDKV